MNRLGRSGSIHRFDVAAERTWVEAALAAGVPGAQPLLFIGKPVTRQVINRVRNSNASRIPKIKQEYRNTPASPRSLSEPGLPSAIRVAGIEAGYSV